MNNSSILKKANNRIKNIDIKEHLINVLLLLVPTIFTIMIFVGVVVLFPTISYLSLILLSLLYFVLPMYYTVERRLQALISNIGNKHLNFISGFKEYFNNKQTGLFGIILSFSTATLISIALLLVFFNIYELMCSPFENAINSYNLLASNLNISTQFSIFENYKDYIHLIKPTIILVSTISLIPNLYVMFHAIDNNLSSHYLATLILPDVDLNFSASQSRHITNSGFKRVIKFSLFKNKIMSTFYVYIIYILLFIFSTFMFLLIDYSSVDNPILFILPMFSTPIISIVYGNILNYLSLMYEFIIVEELSKELHKLVPLRVKTSIYSAFNNPSYIHGEESDVRGDFFKEDIAKGNIKNNADEIKKFFEDLSKQYGEKIDVKVVNDEQIINPLDNDNTNDTISSDINHEMVSGVYDFSSDEIKDVTNSDIKKDNKKRKTTKNK